MQTNNNSSNNSFKKCKNVFTINLGLILNSVVKVCIVDDLILCN